MKSTAEPRDYAVRVATEYTDYGTKVALMVCVKESNQRLGVAWDMDEGPGMVAAKLRSLVKFLEECARAP